MDSDSTYSFLKQRL